MSESWQLGSRYTLERQIGSGAMGQVWVGHDVDGHTLAFKLLRPELADDPGVVARFLQERNLLVGLRSPYVIRVHDLVVEGPRLAIVMDYVAGDSLRALLQRRGNLPPHDVATLGAQIAQGLAAVHGANVLHRDLKPENVLLADDPDAMSRATTETALPAAASTRTSTDALGTLVPRLADFGVASLVTQTGQVATANVIGTPQYLAPELGDGQPSVRAGDLYALGVTLYEMACGAVPFHADSPVALLRLHADHAPTRPDDIPDALWVLIAELLAKNPHERPDDAAAVAQRLWAMAPQFAGAPPRPCSAHRRGRHGSSPQGRRKAPRPPDRPCPCQAPPRRWRRRLRPQVGRAARAARVAWPARVGRIPPITWAQRRRRATLRAGGSTGAASGWR
ncbi:serine/threonine-protein kinase [Dermacoccus nishinomiyaensis]